MRQNLLTAAMIGLALTILALDGVGAALPQSGRHQSPEAVRLKADLVVLPVTVTDQDGRAVSNLKKEDFQVYEEGVQQEISFFSSEAAPVSWGLVLDRSGSMAGMMQEVYEAAVHALEAGTPEDEAFILAFSDRAELIHDFTRDRGKLLTSVRSLRAGGRTALYDSIALGLEHLPQGRHRKKVLLVLTDGMDNESRTRVWELFRLAERSEALIYTIGFFHAMSGMFGDATGYRKDLEELCRRTGGSTHFPRTMEECKRACQDMALEVTHQYSIGYYPSNTTKDGTWRKVQVMLKQEEPRSKYHVRTRAGYSVAKANPGDKP